jgi:hypothetical protein
MHAVQETEVRSAIVFPQLADSPGALTAGSPFLQPGDLRGGCGRPGAQAPERAADDLPEPARLMPGRRRRGGQ